MFHHLNGNIILLDILLTTTQIKAEKKVHPGVNAIKQYRGKLPW